MAMDDQDYRLPPINRLPKNLAGLLFFEIEALHVAEFCPLADGKGPTTEVHLLIKLKGVTPPLIMAFKTSRRLDQFIHMLKRHRNEVWPHEPNNQERAP